MSISGAQEKVSLTLSSDRRTLDVSATGGRYILKPETSRFSAIPKNEHLTMRLAQMLSIETPPFGLLRQDPGGMPYIIRRFDRLDDGTKLQVEDFCQLAGKRVKDKYEGSAELCVKLLKKYATEPLIEIQKFYRLILFCWWAENGDMHLKNFSLLTTPEGIRRLSPAYDLVCTKLVIPDDTLAMPVGGRDRKLTRGIWVEFADYCGIPDKAAKRLISEQIDSLDPALRLISASFLPESMKNQYEALIRANTAILAS
ncbi:MAG: HipA domain-containing protein [Planctomycetia bacterium]|nr:HipA domain-containing protein [Planctomycetia bacterium]